MPKSRIEAFSDGVFAIVITLLVLEIKVPSLAHPVSDAALMAALIDELPVLMSCVVSFFIIAIFWVSHHQFWHSLRQADWALLWLNNLLLLFVVFIPIPTWMIGSYPTLRTPAVAFGAVMTGAGLAFLAMRAYASGRTGLIDMTAAEKRRALVRSGISPVLNLAGAILALWAPLWSFAFYIAVPIIYFLQPPSGRRLR
ncbi:MAG TPA: TMEM175 family protein [Stellaceae bacterium]